MSIKGFKSQQALQQKLNGYTEDQSIDRARYVTVQEMNGKRHALDVLIHGAYQVTVAPKTIEAGSNIRTLKITNHGANENDIIRLSDGTQFSALSVPDANTIITSVELDSSPVGDTCTIWRHITPSYNADGSLNVLASQGPIQFNKDGINTTVNYVTGTPSNSDALPVNIVTVNGQGIATTVDLSGAQINVQLTDRGTSPDAIRIGDGTNLAGVTANNEIKTSDANLLSAMNGVVSTGNSSTATLGANAVFTGSAIEIKDYSAIAVAAISNSDSAVNGLSMQFSPDGVNWDHVHNYSVTGGTGVSYTQACELRYFRVVYTNGAVAQTYFRLTVILKKGNTVPSRYTFDQGIVGTQLADNTKSVIHGLSTAGGGTYVPVKVNPSGALTVDATVSSSVLPTNASTAALQTTGNTSLSSIDTKLTSQATAANQTAHSTLFGAVTETAPATDTASSGLNGRLQRIAQRLTSLIALFPATLGSKADASSFAVTRSTEDKAAIGALTETAPATDTASSGLNGRLQRIAQRLTSLIALLPSAIGPQAKAGSLSITLASDQGALDIKQAATAPTYAESLLVNGSTVTTLTAPAGAKGCKVITPLASSTMNITLDGVTAPSATVGIEFQGGRSEDFIGVGSLKAICQDGAATNQKISVHWYV